MSWLFGMNKGQTIEAPQVPTFSEGSDDDKPKPPEDDSVPDMPDVVSDDSNMDGDKSSEDDLFAAGSSSVVTSGVGKPAELVGNEDL